MPQSMRLERYFAHSHGTRGYYADQWQNATFCAHFNHFRNHKFHFNNSIDSIFWGPPSSAIRRHSVSVQMENIQFRECEAIELNSISMPIGVLELCANILDEMNIVRRKDFT